MAIRRRLALSCCVVALMVVPVSAQAAAGEGDSGPDVSAAQSGDQAASTSADNRAETVEQASLGDIVVTARRRAESIQKVPISITAVFGESLKAQGVQDLKQFSSFVPGVSINNGRPDGGGTTAQMFIRGVGQNDFLIPNEPGVGLYVDDVYVASSSGAISTLGDIQTIEVLRGP